MSLIRFDVYKNNNDMKQTWKNKWLMLLGGMTLLGGLSGCEDRPEGTVPFPEGEAPQRLASTARLNGSPLKQVLPLLM